MSRLPHGWIQVSLEDVVDQAEGLRRGPFGSALKKSIFVEAGYKVYEQKHAIYKDFNLGSYYIDEVKFHELRRFAVRAGDFIVSCSGTIGELAVVPESFVPGVINQALLRIRVNPHVMDPHFFPHLFRSERMQSVIIDNTQGGAMPNLVGMDVFRSIQLILPPLAEQRKIAQILSTWDEAIALVEALIAALKRRKQGLMQRLLTGEVRFPGFEGEWQEFQVSELGEISSGGTPDTTRPEYWGGEIPWVTPSEITALETKYILRTERNITNEGLGSSSARIIPPHSIILCTRATIGEAAINLVPMSTNQGIKSLTLRNDHNTEFVYYLLVHHKHLLKRLANGSTFLELSKADFANIRFLIPHPKEQAAIADLLSNLDVYIEGASTHIKHLREQKRGLMQRLLTGEVRVQTTEEG